MKIQDILLAYDAAVIKQLAREQKLEIKNFGKEQVTAMLAKHLTQPAQIAHTLTQLKPAERAVLTYMQRAGGEVFSGALKQILLDEKIIAPTPTKKNLYSGYDYEPYTGNPAYTGKPALEDVAARLFKLGLVFAHGVLPGTRQMLGLQGGKALVIPSEILFHLPPVETAHETIPAPAQTVPGSARNLQRDLSRYWSFVRRSGTLELMSQGWLYKKTATEITALLGWTPDKKREEKTDVHLFFLRRLLMDLKLLRPEKTNWDVINEQTWVADAEAFWARSPQERTRAAFEAWRDGNAWNELRLPPAVYGSDHRKPAASELVAARKLLLEKIKAYGAGAWVALDTLRDDLHLTQYEFLFPRQQVNYYNPYRTIENTPYYQSNNSFGITYKDIKDEASGWTTVEGAIIAHIVTGPLFWLGLVDLGSENQNAPATAYRLNDTGAWLLGLQDAVEFSHTGGRIVVQPNFQIVAMEPIADGVLMSLDAFAQFEGGENALLYRLSRESLYRGQRSGWDAARVISFLQEMTRIPLPQNVQRSLQEWQSQHERITIRRNVSLLQADTPATLDALVTDTAGTLEWGRRVAPHLALARSDAQTTLRTLHDAGLFPLMTRAGQTDAPASVTADESGALEFFGRVPSIYAYAAVEPFAEIRDEHHAQFTPASIDAAVSHGIPVPDILARLKHVHRGAVPPKLVQRLKAWGKFYGDARLGQLTLVEFRDEAARQELLADPELQAYLAPFDAGARPLALVQAGNVEHVRKLLQERGLELVEFETNAPTN